ncbi:Os09g0388550 [Oryza sativa Japonica Group]|uniref:Os09g0388550 protein n=1 Tax=Oryza sativa subsp. japonica TaxID=39947 RepID=A0A0P0XN31_ORYSJ|nr:hypothetical protein EE612_047546 [Oryza sativa]BAT07895.1 Os09g0388550 [Oryza sativa Japonica Group]
MHCACYGFYRGISPGVTGSLATGTTYISVIESTKTWLEIVNPKLSGHWSHFIAGAIALPPYYRIGGAKPQSLRHVTLGLHAMLHNLMRRDLLSLRSSLSTLVVRIPTQGICAVVLVVSRLELLQGTHATTRSFAQRKGYRCFVRKRS